MSYTSFWIGSFRDSFVYKLLLGTILELIYNQTSMTYYNIYFLQHIFRCRTEYFKNSFFHISLVNGVNLIQTFVALVIIKLLVMQCWNLWDQSKRKSSISEHKFRHGFKDTLNPLCSCSIETQIYFLRYHFCNSNRGTLMNDLENIPISFSTVNDKN